MYNRYIANYEILFILKLFGFLGYRYKESSIAPMIAICSMRKPQFRLIGGEKGTRAGETGFMSTSSPFYIPRRIHFLSVNFRDEGGSQKQKTKKRAPARITPTEKKKKIPCSAHTYIYTLIFSSRFLRKCFLKRKLPTQTKTQSHI